MEEKYLKKLTNAQRYEKEPNPHNLFAFAGGELGSEVHAANLRDTMRGLLGVFGLAEGEMGEDG